MSSRRSASRPSAGSIVRAVCDHRLIIRAPPPTPWPGTGDVAGLRIAVPNLLDNGRTRTRDTAAPNGDGFLRSIRLMLRITAVWPSTCVIMTKCRFN